MVALIITSGVVAVIFGLIMLFSPGFFQSLTDKFNRLVMNSNMFLLSHRIIFGIFMLLAAAWILLCIYKSPQFFLLYIVLAIAFIFGVLFIFFPGTLETLSNYSDVVVFPTDKYVTKYSRALGAVLVIAGIYILSMMTIMLKTNDLR